MTVPFSPPDITEADIEAVTKVLRSGWLTTGPVCAEFEAILTAYTAAAGTIVLNSATAALELALHFLGIGPGDEVIVPAYTYTATASAVLHCGAKPIMVDIEEDSFNLNTDLVAKAITAHTKAIIPVDVAGLPCNYRQLFKIAHEHKNIFKAANNRQEVLGRIAIIADAAHSLGATYQGQPSGSYADLTAFSFHAVKNLTTAEGGALQISKVALKYWPNFYRELRLLSMHGQTKSALEKQTGWEYDIELAGYKCNLTDIAAALGLSQLNRYPAILAKRKAAALHYNGSFNESVFILPLLSNDGNESSYHLYLLRLQNYTEEKRNILISRLRAQGIAANVHYQPLPSLTLYKNLGYNPNHYPVAYHNYNRVISLPLFNNISPQQLDYVSKTLKQLA